MNTREALTKPVLGTLAVAALLAVTLSGPPLTRQHRHMHKEMLKIDDRIRDAERLHRSLRDALEAAPKIIPIRKGRNLQNEIATLRP